MAWTTYGMSVQKILQATNLSVVTIRHASGLNGKCSNSGVTTWSPPSVSRCYEESGKTAMSDVKSITLDQGGRHDFKVIKVCADDVERFTVSLGNLNYGTGVNIACNVTWAEASAAMNRFRDEFDAAFEALVQISTLTPLGVHEEE